MRQAAALLLLLGADDADLVAELGALLRQGVDVEAGRLGLRAGRGQSVSKSFPEASVYPRGLTHPDSSVIRSIKSFISLGVTS